MKRLTQYQFSNLSVLTLLLIAWTCVLVISGSYLRISSSYGDFNPDVFFGRTDFRTNGYLNHTYDATDAADGIESKEIKARRGFIHALKLLSPVADKFYFFSEWLAKSGSIPYFTCLIFACSLASFILFKLFSHTGSSHVLALLLCVGLFGYQGYNVPVSEFLFIFSIYLTINTRTKKLGQVVNRIAFVLTVLLLLNFSYLALAMSTCFLRIYWQTSQTKDIKFDVYSRAEVVTLAVLFAFYAFFPLFYNFQEGELPERLSLIYQMVRSDKAILYSLFLFGALFLFNNSRVTKANF